MARMGNIPTNQEIQELANAAESGDMSAREKLGDLNNRLAKRANERLRYMERTGYDTTMAYQKAKYNIQSLADEADTPMEYFSQSKKLDVSTIVDNLSGVTNFLRSQTASVRGEQERRKKIGNKLIDGGYLFDMDEKGDSIIPDNLDVEKFQKDFYDFLNSGVFQDLKKNVGTDQEVMRAASKAIQNGAKVSDLKRAFRDYQNGGDTDPIELWEKWTQDGAESYYRQGEWHELQSSRKSRYF